MSAAPTGSYVDWGAVVLDWGAVVLDWGAVVLDWGAVVLDWGAVVGALEGDPVRPQPDAVAARASHSRAELNLVRRSPKAVALFLR
jgi:hypothetical protein